VRSLSLFFVRLASRAIWKASTHFHRMHIYSGCIHALRCIQFQYQCIICTVDDNRVLLILISLSLPFSSQHAHLAAQCYMYMIWVCCSLVCVYVTLALLLALPSARVSLKAYFVTQLCNWNQRVSDCTNFCTNSSISYSLCANWLESFWITHSVRDAGHTTLIVTQIIR
jgi:hypothetical protein